MRLFSRRDSTRKRAGCMFLLHVGSARVIGAIVRYSDANVPEVLWSETVQVEMKKEATFEALAAATEDTVGNVIDRTVKNGLHAADMEKNCSRIKGTACFFTAPWYATHLREIHISKNRPFVVSEKITHEVAQKELAQFEEKQKKQYRDAGLKKPSLQILEKVLLNPRLNGYEISRPYGREARTFETLLYTSIVPGAFLSRIRSHIERAFHPDDVALHSFALTGINVIRRLWPEQKEFLLVDVSGEVTEAVLFSGGSFAGAGTISLGGRGIIRKFAKKLSLSPLEAQSSIRLFLTKKGATGVSVLANRVLDELEDEWIKGLRAITKEFSGGSIANYPCFLVAEPLLEAWFEGAVGRQMRRDDPLYGNEGSAIHLLAPAALREFVHFYDSVREDPFLAVDALFAGSEE